MGPDRLAAPAGSNASVGLARIVLTRLTVAVSKPRMVRDERQGAAVQGAPRAPVMAIEFAMPVSTRILNAAGLSR
jgi:hypothetical protein